MLSEAEKKINEEIYIADKSQDSEALLVSILTLGLCNAEKADHLKDSPDLKPVAFATWVESTLRDRHVERLRTNATALLANLMIAAKSSTHEEISQLIKTEVSVGKPSHWKNFLVGTASSVFSAFLLSLVGIVLAVAFNFVTVEEIVSMLKGLRG